MSIRQLFFINIINHYMKLVNSIISTLNNLTVPSNTSIKLINPNILILFVISPYTLFIIYLMRLRIQSNLTPTSTRFDCYTRIRLI